MILNMRDKTDTYHWTDRFTRSKMGILIAEGRLAIMDRNIVNHHSSLHTEYKRHMRKLGYPVHLYIKDEEDVSSVIMMSLRVGLIKEERYKDADY